MALGATSGGVRWLVVRQGFVVAVTGVAIGRFCRLARGVSCEGWCSASPSTIRLTFIVVGVLLTIVAIAASYIPARRATRIDPLEALRGT